MGIAAGVLLALSSAAHSLVGWPSMRQELAAAGAPPDLIFGMKMGWLFGGVCMLVFAAIVLRIFVRRFRGGVASPFPALVIGVAYFLFGAWALVTSGFQPFYFVFIVPAVLLLGAGWGQPLFE